MVSRKHEEAAFHDRDIASRGRKLHSERAYALNRRQREFLAAWTSQRCAGKTILDYCCGSGGFTYTLAESGPTIVGIDISGLSIAHCRKGSIERGIHTSCSYCVMDAENLAFAENTFDLIICRSALHHLELESAYRELARVLKPEGEIICIEPLGYNRLLQWYRRRTPHLRTKWEMEHLLTKASVELAKGYFDRVETRFFTLCVLAALPFRGLPGFGSLVAALGVADGLLLRLPGLKWQAWRIALTLSQPRRGASGGC